MTSVSLCNLSQNEWKRLKIFFEMERFFLPMTENVSRHKNFQLILFQIKSETSNFHRLKETKKYQFIWRVYFLLGYTKTLQYFCYLLTWWC
jgi:hypothetical protein